ncbi:MULTISPECIES: SMI1/KNR4 family protein [Pseudoalteromonas]|uniref:SMI1/KNR4 family protein n=1 Tax=Pseudoalteromonas TaxID=53246 RepID=UPI000FFEDFE9|nr:MULTISPECIES: SMI1/KNR4 family protein [Pseudoalteromonas]MCG9761806.1 SMI1/KNR4 family protein [Pseudoalteromonas sp. Isolate6]NKC20258.1 SMI1/KNR4 family protein [Pseudoalteromonas galatheae]RXE89638.1 SMI1/KNR4 family protein [Pseudoalteromonas sp. A757]
MITKCNDSYELNNSSIFELENFCRIKLPYLFIEFFRNNNGVAFEGLTYAIDNKERLIERTLLITNDSKLSDDIMQYEIKVVLAQIEERLTDNEDLVGVELLPFAYVFGGDFLCLNFKDSNTEPSVVLWDHTGSDELSPVYALVSDSFEEFIEGLCESEYG